MVSDGDGCDDRMRGSVNGRDSVGKSILYENLRSISRNLQLLAKDSSRDGRDHSQCGGIDDRDCHITLVGHVSLIAIGGNANIKRCYSNSNGRDHLVRRRVDNGYGGAIVVSSVEAVTRGSEGKTTAARPGGNTRYLVGGGINHVHLSRGIVRDICEASIRRELDGFGPLPGDKDSGDD